MPNFVSNLIYLLNRRNSNNFLFFVSHVDWYVIESEKTNGWEATCLQGVGSSLINNLNTKLETSWWVANYEINFSFPTKVRFGISGDVHS